VDDGAEAVLQAAIDCCFFPLYEVECGRTTITYDPDAMGRRHPVSEWLGLMGKTKHLLAPKNASLIKELEKEVQRRWMRLKAMHEHPLL
jgi:pyruvate ferredoxin oxidoreductase alpha subunit